jgi:NADH:ubiquinone oxidoreductase subunit E
LNCTRCVGACAMAPVVIVDDKVYGNVALGQVPQILADYGFGEESATLEQIGAANETT